MDFTAFLADLANLPADISAAIPAVQAVIADVENAVSTVTSDVQAAVATLKAFLAAVNPPAPAADAGTTGTD